MVAITGTKNTKMQQWLNYRCRVRLHDSRVMVGQLMAFDKHMNVVLADTTEFRRLNAKGQKDNEREVKRTLGLIVLRGEHIISINAEAPPPMKAKVVGPQGGHGRGVIAGRGVPIAPMGVAPPRM